MRREGVEGWGSPTQNLGYSYDLGSLSYVKHNYLEPELHNKLKSTMIIHTNYAFNQNVCTTCWLTLYLIVIGIKEANQMSTVVIIAWDPSVHQSTSFTFSITFCFSLIGTNTCDDDYDKFKYQIYKPQYSIEIVYRMFLRFLIKTIENFNTIDIQMKPWQKEINSNEFLL